MNKNSDKAVLILSILVTLLFLGMMSIATHSPTSKVSSVALTAVTPNTVPLVTTIVTSAPVVEAPSPTEPSPVQSVKHTQPTLGESQPSQTAAPSEVAMGDMPVGCIRKYESGGTTDEGGNYQDSGGGAYQIIHGTWNGYGGYDNAEDAPPGVQDQKAADLWAENGHAHWAAQRGRCF